MYVLRSVCGMACLFIALIAGCSSGPTLYPVKGAVTLADGKPLTQGEIIFASDQFTDRALIGTDGSFALKLPEGKYKLFFQGTTIQVYMSDEPPKYLVPKKFTALDTTTLTQAIEGNTDDMDVKVPADAAS